MMSTIIEQLRDLSLILFQKEKKISVEDIVKTSAAFVLGESKINYTIESEPSLLPIYADSAQLYRVFQNILMNAKQAMNNEGDIRIQLKNINNDGEIRDLKKRQICLYHNN